MSDERDAAFRRLLDDVRRFNSRPSIERREAAEAAAFAVVRAKGWELYRPEEKALPDTLVIQRHEDGTWPDWVMIGLGWTLDDSHDLNAVMDGIWRERPR